MNAANKNKKIECALSPYITGELDNLPTHNRCITYSVHFFTTLFYMATMQYI